MPEELRYWKPAELEYLKIGYDAIKKADPRKRPVWMYEPGHRTATALAKLLPWQDISGKGMYTNYSSRMDERIWTRWTMEQQNEAIRMINSNAMSMAIPEMFQQPPVDRIADIPAWVRHDAYSGLLNGAEAVVIFSFGRRKNFEAYQTYYQAWSDVARELTDPTLPLGTVFLRGEDLTPPRLQIDSGERKVTLLIDKKKNEEVTYDALQVRCLQWNGSEFLFLINSSNKPMQVSLQERGWNDLNGTSVNKLSFNPWQVHVLKK